MISFRLAWVWLLFVSTCLSLVAQTTDKPSFESHNFHVEIPINLVKQKILIPVEIEGETFQFILDTGGKFAVSQRLVDKFNFEVLDSATVYGINRISQTYAIVQVPDISFGGLHFKNYRAGTSPFFESFPVSCLEVDGMLGREMLNQINIQYDLDANIVRLTDQIEKLNIDPTYQGRLKYDRGEMPRLTVYTPKGKIKRVIFDTGASDLFSIQTRTFDKLSRKGIIDTSRAATFHGIFSLGISLKIPAPTDQYKVWFPEVTIAGFPYRNFYSDISKRSNARIGTGLLAHGILTVVPKRKTFYFQPYRSETWIKPSRTFGVGMRQDGKHVYIASLLKGSPAEQSGIQIGARIHSINGTPVDSLMIERTPCEQYREGTDWFLQDQLSITIQSPGEENRTYSFNRMTLGKP